jgi:hypothetical protein
MEPVERVSSSPQGQSHHPTVTGLDEEAQLQVRNYDPVTTLEVFLALPVVPCDRRAVWLQCLLIE